MEATAIRWISLAVIVALGALAGWAFADATRRAPDETAGDAHPDGLAVVVRRPGQAPEVIQVEDGILIGRSPACRIVFDDSTVSKQHARLHVRGGTVVVEDLDSTNGTLVNGKAIEGPMTLRRGDRIGCGPNVIVVAGHR